MLRPRVRSAYVWALMQYVGAGPRLYDEKKSET